jgi:hypothetical protein
MIEAMSAGCLVVGSDSPPMREVIDGKNGILVPFFDIEQLSELVIEALAHPRRFTDFRTQARRTAVEQFDMERKCLPLLPALLRREAPRRPRRPQRASVRRGASRRAKREQAPGSRLALTQPAFEGPRD